MSESVTFPTEVPIPLTEGEKPSYTCTVVGATTISGASVAIYKNGSGSNLATTLSMTTGSFAYGTGYFTTPTFQNFKGGNKYVAVITLTIDGIIDVKKIQWVVAKPKDLL